MTETERIADPLQRAYEGDAWWGTPLREALRGITAEPADWPEPGEPTQARWEAALAELDAAHRELVQAVRGMPPERLDATLGDARDWPLGSGVTFYVLLHGLAQHDAAHAAQVSLLRKALG
jgi:hypothetical protein